MQRKSSVGELLGWGRRELAKLGKVEAQASSERILEDVLGFDRARLYLSAPERLSQKAVLKFKRLVGLRKSRIPLAYLLGKAHFWNEVLRVGPGCLIPRPETEILVEQFIREAGFAKDDSFTFLDLASGSGAIGLALLNHFPKSRGVFSDVSPAALGWTRRNIKSYGFSSRAEIVRSDLFSAWKQNPKWNAIVCNPPYLSAKDWRTAQPELRREPREALQSGKDGYEFYRRLIPEAPRYLKTGGRLFLEIGKGQARTIQKLLNENSFYQTVRIFKDYAKIDRVIMAKIK